MMIHPIINSFVSGEFSPFLYDRIDLDQYYNAAKTIENFSILPYGGLLRIPGTYFVAETKYSAKKSRLIPFKFNVTQTYMLEFGDGYIRFYKDNGYIVESAKNITGATNANPVVITCASHGYSTGDEVYISGVGGMAEINGKRFIITVINTNTFSLNGIDGASYGAYTSGGTSERVYTIASPYLEADLPRLQYAQNADVMWITHPNYKTKKLTRTGHTAWSLADYTPTADPFVHNAWQASHAYAVDDYVIPATPNGYYYRCVTAGTSGSSEPTWPTTIGATVTDGGATWRCEFDQPCNYPACVTFHEERLCFAYTRANPQTIWATKSGDFEDMTQGTADDDALEYTLGTNEVNVIRWLLATRILVIGTSGGVLTLGSTDATSPITPTNVMVHRENNEGCYPLMPLLVGSYVYYLHRDAKRIMQFAYDYDSDAYQSIDISILAEHITGNGIVEMAYQQSPYNMLWCVRNDGVAAILTRNILQRITGWARKTTDGIIESVASIPRQDGDYDEVWFIVKRTINGATKRYVEYLKSYTFSAIEDAFFVDCGLSYTGSAVTTISGLDHLEGESVAILADGAVHPNKTVSSGNITLEWAASKVHIGLPYTSVVEMLDLDIQNRFETTFARKKKITKAFIDFYRTVGGYAGVGSKMDEIYFRDSSMPMDKAVSLFSGIKEIAIPYGFDRSINLKITQEQPLPMCIRGIGISEIVNER